MGVVLGQTAEDELFGLFFGLFIVTAGWIDAVGSRLGGHQCGQEKHAAHGESVEQARGADGVETHEDVALLQSSDINDVVVDDGILQQRRGSTHGLGCLKLLLAHVGKRAEGFLTKLKLLTINSREKSTLSRQNSCRESCHLLSRLLR